MLLLVATIAAFFPRGSASLRRRRRSLGGFTFTNWHTHETAGLRRRHPPSVRWPGSDAWRGRRDGEPRAARLLLLIVYLAGVSIGNHLLALLAGPAVIAFLVATLRLEPATDPTVRRTEWGQVAVVAGIWALLIGTGLGSTALVVLGGVCFVGAAAYAAAGGAGLRAGELVLAVVAVTPYLYLYLARRSPRRSTRPPRQPSTPCWPSFGGAQYPPRRHWTIRRCPRGRQPVPALR